MIIQDPAGMLDRIPELRALCEDAKVKRAVEGGDPFKVYRALVWAKWLGRLGAHRQTLNALVDNRRLFARPLKGSLWLGTMNGFGASLVGASEPDRADGTSIAVHAIVAIFAIPLFPLGAYVVRPAEGGVLSRSWQIFARVPMGSLSWLYSRAVAVALLLVAASGALSAFHASRNQDLWLVNAFEAPLQVAIAGKTATVPANGGRVKLNVPIGHQRGEAKTAEGTVIDTVELEVRAGTDLLAWNIAGGAPLYRDRAIYYRDASSAPAEDPNAPPDAVYCGQRTVELRDVDYVFATPPRSISMSEHEARVVRTFVDLGRDKKEGLVDLCVGYLYSKGETTRLLPVVTARAAISGWKREPTVAALGIAMLSDPSAAADLARRLRDLNPGDMEQQRTYQSVMERVGRSEEVRKEYQARAAAHPDSAPDQYLAARLLTGRAALVELERLAARFPDDADILRTLTYTRYAYGDFAGAAAAWEKLQDRSPQYAIETIEAGAGSLVAIGKGARALDATAALFDRASQDDRDDLAEVYACASRRLGTGDAERLIAQYEAAWQGAGEEAGDRADGPERVWPLRARAGLPIDGAPASDAVKLASLVARDPDAALKLVPAVGPAQSSWIGQGGWGILYGEAIRSGDAKAAKTLGTFPYLTPEAKTAFERYVKGEEVDLLDFDVAPQIRAAAHVVRAHGAVPAGERQRLLEEARKADPLQGVVSTAARTWKL